MSLDSLARGESTSTREAGILRVRWQVAALQVKLSLLRLGLVLHAYNPGQPRVSAGNPDGGRWTDEDWSDDVRSEDDARITYVGDQSERQYSVDLQEEEARGGHALRSHIGRTDAELLTRVRRERWSVPFVTVGRRRAGSFPSRETANDLVNRTLERNTSLVDAVAEGRQDTAFLKARFGHRTGREAYRPSDASPFIRETYGVGAYIVHDSQSSRGYRVQTAYPRNDGD
ncbi:RNase A-like domain-containing protein [Methylobacterium durans]|uniref:RNase A-like domain-containing protein n=1 Tax=Methylobacterium durans TaxID=2202825 RepID=UPI002AFFD4C5|nr:RNase A-like domain-containing protein [Methylobacterium durans]MEA1832156.1 RNase A-like domain-containing protein [Methylobacterium durans]